MKLPEHYRIRAHARVQRSLTWIYRRLLLAPSACYDLNPALNEICKKAVGSEGPEITGDFSEFGEGRAFGEAPFGHTQCL